MMLGGIGFVDGLKRRRMGKTLKARAMALVAIVLVAGLAACGVAPDTSEQGETGGITISLAGWTFSTRPEFKVLAKAYEKAHPSVRIDLKEYSADDYDKQLIADLSASKSPDVFPIKNLRMYYTYADSGKLAKLDDMAVGLAKSKDMRGISGYRVDGSVYALPYRQDVWLLFYNKTMLNKAGIDVPDGSWTWKDYERITKRLKSALPKAGYKDAYPTYHHTTWQSVPQGFALAQQDQGEANSVFFGGDYRYLKSVYAMMLRMQDEGLMLSYNTVSSSKTTYQSQFGMQKAALLPMATWYMGPLTDQQSSGDAQRFEWGVTVLPQRTHDDVSHPKSFGDPTGFAVSGAIGGAKLKAAKDFVRWACGEEGAKVLADTGTLPAYLSDDVVDRFLARKGMPKDEESRRAITDSMTIPENPVGEATQTIQDELNIAHTSILSETKNMDDALSSASKAIVNSGLLDERYKEGA